MIENPLRSIAAGKPTILLVGGPRDGEWVDDKGAAVLVTPPAPHAYLTGATLIVTDNYFRSTWRRADGSEEIAYYYHESLSQVGALLRLLVHYRPPKENRA